MSETTEHVILIKHESLKASIVSDLVTFGTGVGLIGVGTIIDNGAMEVVGALMFMLVVVGRTVAASKRSRKTIAEARQYLNELEASK